MCQILVVPQRLFFTLNTVFQMVCQTLVALLLRYHPPPLPVVPVRPPGPAVADEDQNLPDHPPQPSDHVLAQLKAGSASGCCCFVACLFDWFFALGTLTGRVDLEGGRNSVSGGRTTKDIQSLLNTLRTT